MFNSTLLLSNGISCPQLALGTWLIPDDEAAEAVRQAIHIGYRHIDTAQAYENERGVGEGVRLSGIPREQLFITSKVAAEIKSYREAAESIDESLRVSGLDYLDLMLIHCPQPWEEYEKNPYRYEKENREVWRALEEAYAEGKLRAIGVSNFNEHDIENLCETATVKPMVNQIYCHIGHTPLQLIDFCTQQHILLEAYSPVAHGRAMREPEFASILGKYAEKYGVSIAQLCIRYCLQLNMAALPKTTNPQHMRENTELEFHISPEDMQRLAQVQA